MPRTAADQHRSSQRIVVKHPSPTSGLGFESLAAHSYRLVSGLLYH